MNSIGDVIFFLYDNFMNTMLPMLQKFVDLLTSPIEDIFSEFGFIGDIIGWLTSLFLDDISLLEFMIGSGITLYVTLTLAKYLIGLVDAVLPDIPG